jgi:DNA replication protein DnaC
MMMHTTIAQLRELKLEGLATALQGQLAQPDMAALSFEERFGLLVERELHHRQDRRLERLLKNARLKYGQATIEDIDSRAGRGVNRTELISLALGGWVSAGHSILITGPTRAGKSWLACALAPYACRRGHNVLYQRVPRLQEELRIRHGSGAFGKCLLQLAKTDVLLLDDWGMGALDSATRSDLLEIIDDRAAHKATIITSQLPIEHWARLDRRRHRGRRDPGPDHAAPSPHHADRRVAAPGTTKDDQEGEKYRPIVTAELRI